MHSTHTKLTARWQTTEGQARRAEVIHSLQHRRDLRRLSFLDTYDGRLDLRGISLRKAPTAQVPITVPAIPPLARAFTVSLGVTYHFRKLKVVDVDLSYADLGRSTFRECEFANVLFRQADCSGWNEGASHFTNVAFDGANLSKATLGADGARYENTSFRQARMQNTFCYRGYFTKCDFSEALIKQVDFQASHFDHCRFAGRLEGVWFRGYYASAALERRYGRTEINSMRNVDFSEAELWDVGFNNNCDLSSCVLPHDGNHFLFRHWPILLELAQKEVERTWTGTFQESASRWLSAQLSMLCDQHMYIVNRRELEHPVYAGSIGDDAHCHQYSQELVTLLRQLESTIG